MEVKVLRPFSDKFNLSRLYSPGEVINFEEKRAENIVSRGLGEYVTPEKVEKPKVEKPKEEAPKVEAPKVEAPEHEATPSESAPVQPKKRGRKSKKEAE